jgi:hypothetical protein
VAVLDYRHKIAEGKPEEVARSHEVIEAYLDRSFTRRVLRNPLCKEKEGGYPLRKIFGVTKSRSKGGTNIIVE